MEPEENDHELFSLDDEPLPKDSSRPDSGGEEVEAPETASGAEANDADAPNDTRGSERKTTPRLLAPISSTGTVSLRKTHSATLSVSGFGDAEELEESFRPYTAADADDLPSNGNATLRSRRKKASSSRKEASNTTVVRDDRPRSADLNGWGDFDADRLLGDSSTVSEVVNPAALDPLDGQRARSRKSRRSTPATKSPRSDPWEDSRGFNADDAEPGTHVLRQRPMESADLDLVSQLNYPSARRSTTPKPLLGRHHALKAPLRSRPTSCGSSRPTTPAPLFGSDIPESLETRMLIFERLSRLWMLISRRSLGSPPQKQSISGPPGSGGQTRSPFECSMAMVKICRALGISLASPSATHLSFWYSKEQGVDFEAFCDLVIRSAVQPALHHFSMDTSISEYLSTLDLIVESLLPSTGSRQLKELAEIQPVFPTWREGISSRLAQPTTINADERCASPAKTPITADGVRKALEGSVSQRLLALRLPSEEARVTHVDNIRRKVQLHKSWKLRDSGRGLEDGVVGSNSQFQAAKESPAELQASNPYGSNQTRSASDLNSSNLRVGSDGAHPVASTTKGTPALPEEIDPKVAANSNNVEPACPQDSDEVLVCCRCSVRGAELWCSACFTVNCQKCWQEVHSCTVDMSSVPSSTDPPTSSSEKVLLGPTTLAIKKKRCSSATLSPPVAMIYLPIKAMTTGTLAKGNAILRHHSVGRRAVNQQFPAKSMGDSPSEVIGVVAHALLPALHKSQSDTAVLHHQDRVLPDSETIHTDSTAELVKSLMARVSPSTPGSGSRSLSSNSSVETMKRPHKNFLSRPKLQLSAVSLDATLLQLGEPARRR
ncbi:hypothetical protein BBJ28_00002993 [Nothophytophthora sp. Chile5]|nr:hypothetical protein BBJ28_00002993 [Nothophytophthora sp. Chile5]